MKLTTKQYAQGLLEAITETNPKDHDLVLDKFVKILAQNGILDKSEEIEKEYRILENEAKGINTAEITMARESEIDNSLINELNRIVSKKLDIKTKIDKGIIGGVIVKVDDTLIDASVKTQLKNLKKSLKE